MNWGLFLGLESFLLPLSLALRIGLGGLAASSGAADLEMQRVRSTLRGILLMFLLAICAGKLPAAIYATTGDLATLGRVAESFMVTPLGITQMVCLTVGVLAADLFDPGLGGRRDDGAPARSPLLRSLGIIGVCLALGLVGVR